MISLHVTFLISVQHQSVSTQWHRCDLIERYRMLKSLWYHFVLISMRSQRCHCVLTDWRCNDIRNVTCSDIILCLSQRYHYGHAIRYLSMRSQRCHCVLTDWCCTDIRNVTCSDIILCLSQRYYYGHAIRYISDIIVCISQRYHYDIAIWYW